MSVRLDHGEDTLDEMHEINVTPFIDVMLVLLIIFMVAAPLATVDILVNLPASTADAQPRPDRPLYLTVKSDLTLALGDDSVSRDLLPGTLDAAAKGDKDTRICVRTRRYLMAS
jgi:biopolymer transport protein ExbD